MKTSLKEGIITGLSAYGLANLANEAEIRKLIDDAQKQLLPCPCCELESPIIRYTFNPQYRATEVIKYSELIADCEMRVVEYPHTLYAECPRVHQKPETVDKGCGMRTQEWHAEDDEVDFKEALRLIVEAWNKRPSN